MNLDSVHGSVHGFVHGLVYGLVHGFVYGTRFMVSLIMFFLNMAPCIVLYFLYPAYYCAQLNDDD